MILKAEHLLIAKNLWNPEHRIRVVALHIPGVDNDYADTTSRKFSKNCERELDQKVVTRLFILLGEPKIILFASRTY